MKNRIIGFDLARAYAIFGMYIVNFNFSFGSFSDTSLLGKFLNLFVGNSTAIFIILAGMGLSFMTNKTYTIDEKKRLKSVVLKRSWFLLAIGLLLFSWWPGDILHFYGGYMHIAAFLLFVPKKYFLMLATICILIFHILLMIIPIDTGWDFTKFQPTDFWTPIGFLRNTFYNGWNSIFPWLAYFMLGMWLGRLDWNIKTVKRNVFIVGFIFFSIFEILRIIASQGFFNEYITQYIMSEYFPPYLPFMVITASYALMIIAIFMFIGEIWKENKIIQYLSTTGKMTLSLYIFHLTIGMLIFSSLTGLTYTGSIQIDSHATPKYILVFAIVFYLLSVCLCVLWSKKFQNGPVETLMRKISK